jgi:hypothetical protein
MNLSKRRGCANYDQPAPTVIIRHFTEEPDEEREQMTAKHGLREFSTRVHLKVLRTYQSRFVSERRVDDRWRSATQSSIRFAS